MRPLETRFVGASLGPISLIKSAIAAMRVPSTKNGCDFEVF